MQTLVLKEKGILVSTLSDEQVSGVNVGFCYVRGTCGILIYCLYHWLEIYEAHVLFLSPTGSSSESAP